MNTVLLQRGGLILDQG